MAEKKKTLFHVAALRHEPGEGGGTTVIVEPKIILALNAQDARDRTLIDVGADHQDHMDQVQVLVAPFA